MKKMKTRWLIMVSVLIACGMNDSALAFHSGGVANCDGCHSMHNSADNPIGGGIGAGQVQAAVANTNLLKGSDPSSTCLNCHFGSGGIHVASVDGSNVNQGGDFYWITKDYTVDVSGTSVLFSKYNHGHSIVAIDYGMAADPNNAVSPGGAYPASSLGCDSCHNPHGQVGGGTGGGGAPISGSGSYGDPDPSDGSILGNYRLLGDASYTPPGGTQFTYPAPIARATDDPTSSYGTIVDYGSGMSEWCANCHTQYINTTVKHPAGNVENLPAVLITNYNSYVATGNFTGDVTTAYDGLVPFERGTTDRTTLFTDPVMGVDTNSNVMCLTCHRAHASANANAGRWDFEVTFLIDSNALNSVEVDRTTAAVYYKAGTNGMVTNDIVGEYGPYQRSLCNKCHVKD
jgi:hypothetical protein